MESYKFRCQRCESDRILEFSARHKDQLFLKINGNISEDYNPCDVGLGKCYDDLEGFLCLNCGQLQGKWPLDICSLENDKK